jgi:hypothetical protein
MPNKTTKQRALRDRRQGKSRTTQAGEFVREEIHHVREGKHGARSPEQAIAIGLSKARRAGVAVPPRGSAATRKRARRDIAKGRHPKAPSRRRSRAVNRTLKRESRSTTSRGSLARHARRSARRRGPAARSASARKAARTRASRG